MKFIHAHLERQNRRLSEIYGADSSVQFRASNMCHIMLVYMCVTGALFIYALARDQTDASAQNLYYAGFLAFLFVMLGVFYRMTLTGRFKVARFAYIAINVMFVVPATLLTGGIPESATMTILPLPMLYAFCLYDGKKSLIFTAIYVGLMLGIALVPLAMGIDLPDFSRDDITPARRKITFFILLAMLSFTLIALQYENRRAVKKAKDAAVAKSEFLANMSHEIRTPMNGVLGLTDILMTKPMPPDQKEILRVIQTSGQSLLTIINDILDFSRLESGQVKLDPVSFNLETVINDIRDLMQMQAEEKGLEILVNVDADCPQNFIGDDSRIRQILLNLVGNAIKFTSSGNVTIAVSLTAERTLQIDVIDTGIGIPADRIDAIFEQFTQADNSTSRRFGGTGLGLSICQKLANIMGGELSVKSIEGEGARFTVSLPLEINENIENATPVKLLPAVHENTLQTQDIEQTVLIFLSRSQMPFRDIISDIDSSDYQCFGLTSVGDMRAYLSEYGGALENPPVIVLEWSRDVGEFLNYAERLRSLEHCDKSRFVLCLRNPTEQITELPKHICVVEPPVMSEAVLQAVKTLTSRERCKVAS